MRIILTILLLSYTIVSLGNFSSIEDPRSPDYFFTNRNKTREDTLYLPVHQKCLLIITVYRYVDAVREVDNSNFWESIYLYNSNLYLKDLNENIKKEFCYTPIRYRRIFPMLTRIYDIESLSQKKYPNQLVDLIHLRQDTIFNINYWGCEFDTDLGNKIAEYMPMIELYLQHKISNEITLIDSNRKFIAEQLQILVCPCENQTYNKVPYSSMSNEKHNDSTNSTH